MSQVQKSFLFFLVHPSKYYLFRGLINNLLKEGHKVDVVITSKDVLENLIINEGWEYTDLFPEGRRSKAPNRFIIMYKTLVNFIKTVYRLYKFTSKRKHDFYITDDSLTVVGWLRKVPTLFYIDDDLKVVPETTILMFFTNYIFAPSVTDMGRHNKLIVPFYGYKELGSFHPKNYNPNYEVVKQFNPEGGKYFILRLVSLTASHDVGKKGLDNAYVKQLIDKLEAHGKVFITSERELPEEFEKYRIQVSPNDISHALYHCEFLISDSQTMSAEAGVLGVPYIRYNDFVGRIAYLNELEEKFNLGVGVKTHEIEKLDQTINLFLNNPNLKEEHRVKRYKMLEEKVCMTDFMIWLFQDLDNRLKEVKSNPDIQKQFIGVE